MAHDFWPRVFGRSPLTLPSSVRLSPQESPGIDPSRGDVLETVPALSGSLRRRVIFPALVPVTAVSSKSPVRLHEEGSAVPRLGGSWPITDSFLRVPRMFRQAAGLRPVAASEGQLLRGARRSAARHRASVYLVESCLSAAVGPGVGVPEGSAARVAGGPLPARRRLCESRGVAYSVVASLTPAGWNRIVVRLRHIDGLRRAA